MVLPWRWQARHQALPRPPSDGKAGLLAQVPVDGTEVSVAAPDVHMHQREFVSRQGCVLQRSAECL